MAVCIFDCMAWVVVSLVCVFGQRVHDCDGDADVILLLLNVCCVCVCVDDGCGRDACV